MAVVAAVEDLVANNVTNVFPYILADAVDIVADTYQVAKIVALAKMEKIAAMVMDRDYIEPRRASDSAFSCCVLNNCEQHTDKPSRPKTLRKYPLLGKP